MISASRFLVYPISFRFIMLIIDLGSSQSPLPLYLSSFFFFLLSFFRKQASLVNRLSNDLRRSLRKNLLSFLFAHHIKITLGTSLSRFRWGHCSKNKFGVPARWETRGTEESSALLQVLIKEDAMGDRIVYSFSKKTIAFSLEIRLGIR